MAARSRSSNDGDGNRVAKTANGVTTRYLVDDLNPTGYVQVVEELNGGVVQRQYTYGLQRISQQQAISNTWTPSFYGYDGGGSVQQLTNSTAQMTDSYDYDAFGNVLNKTGSTPNEVLYRGEQYDPDLGLYYLRVRYMNSLNGRLMSRDPYDGYIGIPVTLHKYLYVGGDPVNHVDPRGRFLAEYALENSDSVSEAKLVGIYGCVADAGLTAVDLLLDKSIKGSTGLGIVGTAIGCVLLTPEVDELAQQENVIVERADFLSKALGWGGMRTECRRLH
jgi:RHS repeat-associated protein